MASATAPVAPAPLRHPMPTHPEIPRLVEAIASVYRGNRAAIDLLAASGMAPPPPSAILPYPTNNQPKP